MRGARRRPSARSRRSRVAAYTIPTDAPESDGTLEWDSTTIVVVEVAAGGETRHRLHLRAGGRGALIDEQLAPARRRARRARHRRRACGDARRRCATPGRPGIGAMALSAVDVALWDLKAKLLERPARDAARPRRATRCRSTAAAASARTRSSELARAARRLGRQTGIPRVKMKVGREPDRRRRRASAPRATAIGDDAELYVDANGALHAEAGARAAPTAFAELGVTLVRGAGQLRRPRRPAAACATARRRGWTSRPASTPATPADFRGCSSRRRRLPAGRRDALRRHHRLARGRRARARRTSSISPATARRRSTRTCCCAVSQAAAPRVVPRPRAHRAACSSTASSSPTAARSGPIPTGPASASS